MVSKKIYRLIALVILLVVLLNVLTACSSNSTAPAAGDQLSTGEIAMAPMDNMPAEVKSAPATVQQAYSFAVANPEIVKRLPCYCGCGAMGHHSLYSCYVSNAEPSGKINFDTHALGCSICVDIAQDAMRLIREGQSVDQVKAYVDETYSKFGTSNLP